MGLVYIKPETIVINNDWIRKNVTRYGYEVVNCELEDIIAEWCYSDFIIRIIDSCDIYWAALYDGRPVGAGAFRWCGGTVREGCQAVLPKFQKRGIYTSVLEWIIEWAGPFSVENDCQQTLEMQRIWHRMNCVLA